MALKQQGDPGEPVVGNAYEQTKPSLPLSWESAIAALRQATVLPEYLRSPAIETLCGLPRSRNASVQCTDLDTRL